MKEETRTLSARRGIILVLGGSGKTGRRVVSRLQDRGLDTRAVSRSSDPAFDWDDPRSWDHALDGVKAASLTKASMDRAAPGIARSGA